MTKEGILLVDKPAGMTSYDVVRRVKRAIGIPKTGHGGTLDPFATGLLVVLIGRKYTRMQPLVMQGDKIYDAVFRIGMETDTGDLTGQTIAQWGGDLPGFEDIEPVLHSFEGEIQQKPHPYSAVKYQGRPLYYYARQGIDVPIQPRPVRLYEMDVLGWEPPDLRIRIRVSKGFYVRSLALDLGRKLGTGATVAALRRLAVGRFRVEDAVGIAEIRRENPELTEHIIKQESGDVPVV